MLVVAIDVAGHPEMFGLEANFQIYVDTCRSFGIISLVSAAGLLVVPKALRARAGGFCVVRG